MSHRKQAFPRRLVLAACLLFIATAAWGQQTSAQLSGVVKDPQGAVIPGAKIVILNEAQGAVTRELTTGPDGSFVVFPLNPATYTVRVEVAGFKQFTQKDVKLFTNDRVALPPIVLEVGAATESVTVEASAAQLQTEDAARSGIITGLQTNSLALNGRNYLSLTALVPGILSTATNDVAGPGGIASIYANGQRARGNSVALDGVTNMDTGANGTQLTSLNIDAVAEFRVLTNSQPADFGRVPGAMINIVTKSGGRDFHGTGYWFHRHDDLNANTWLNNKNGQPRKLYRYNYAGYNIGGPIFIPGKFNKDKNKLFFFFAEEFQRQLLPQQSAMNATVPTALQRDGDFSQTRDGSNVPVIIKDPTNGGQPFAGNIVPKNLINPDGQRMLNYLPLPNVTGNPSYNLQTQISGVYPRRQEMARVDWNINDRWRAFFRVVLDKDAQQQPYGLWSSAANIPLGPVSYNEPAQAGIVNITTVISPTLTNEFIFGPSRNRLTILPTTDGQSASKMGLQNIKLPFPNANVLNLVPAMSFGGVPSGVNYAFNNVPFYNVNDNFDFTDNLTKIFANHQFKMGFYIQRSRKDQTSETPLSGTFNFGRDSANPNDSNWAFSNALLGNFQSFTQGNTMLNSRLRFTDAEWYVADSWKVRTNLTLSYGVRFYIQQPQYDVLNRGANFDSSYFDPAQAALLFQRAKDASGKVVAKNPMTGQLLPAVYIGALVPGVGEWQGGAYVNGIARAGEGYPRGIIRSRGVHYAPRFGIAWNLKPKTVFRAGGGVFYDRIWGTGGVSNPPALIAPTIYYGSFASLASSAGTMFPSGLSGFMPDGHLPATYNWNASIQQELPFRMLLDVGYVGSVSRHQLYTLNVNGMPFGSAWLPQSQDPTTTPKYDGTTTLPINYLRPFQGYGDINLQAMGGSMNYNAMQVNLNRRLAKGLQAGVAYTWSHSLGTAGAQDEGMNPINMRVANYGPLAFDRRHMLVLNYVYDVPGLSRRGFLNNAVGRAIFNNWQVSGITSFISGAPASLSYGIQNVSVLNRMITGSDTWGPRPVLTADPTLDSGARTWDAYINTSALRPAVKGSVGMDSAWRQIVGPGVNNWDVSVFKNFPFSKDGVRNVQLRCEMFNAPNHTQFSGLNTGATFNAAGQLTNLPTSRGGGGGAYGFGALNNVRNPRIIQLAAKIYF